MVAEYSDSNRVGTYFNNEIVDVFLVQKDIGLQTPSIATVSSFFFTYILPLDVSKMTLQKEEVDEVKYLPFTTVEQAYYNNDPTFVVSTNCMDSYKRFFDHLHKLTAKTK